MTAIILSCAMFPTNGNTETERPTLPAQGFWNGNNGNLPIVECISLDLAPRELLLSVRDRTGALRAEDRFTIRPLGTWHSILKDLPGIDIRDQYGTYVVSLAEGGDAPIACHTAVYRFSSVKAQKAVDYAFSEPLTDPLSGESGGIYNSMNLSGASDPVLNWLSLYNGGTLTFAADLLLYDSNGRELSRIRLQLAPQERRDLAVGHDRGQEVGLYRIVPLDSQAPYYAFLTRYSRSGGTFNFAIPLRALSGSSHPNALPASSMDPAYNYGELANLSPHAARVRIRVTDPGGRSLFDAHVTLAPYAQIHVPLAEIIGPRSVGSFHVSTDSPGVRLIAQSIFYGYRAGAPSQIEWAYSTQAEHSSAHQGPLAVPLNTFLGSFNWQKIHSEELEPVQVNLSVSDASGQRNQALASSIAGQGSVDIDLHSGLGSNQLGVATITPERPLSLTSELLRVYPGSRGEIGYIMNIPAFRFALNSGGNHSSSSSVSQSSVGVSSQASSSGATSSEASSSTPSSSLPSSSIESSSSSSAPTVPLGRFSEQAQCNDGLDNDNDGAVDYASDPGCFGPGDDDEKALPKSGAGWSDFSPSSDTTIVYVSSSLGDDANCTSYSATLFTDPFAPSGIIPCRTIARGRALVDALPNNRPDWLLLRRGDQFENQTLNAWRRSGRSVLEPFLFGAYGDSPLRPVILLEAEQSIAAHGSSHPSFLAIVGIEFYAHTRDVNSPSFAGPSGGQGIRWLNYGSYLHIEDCAFRHASVVFDINDGLLRTLVFRRNTITDSYNTNGHAQGMFLSHVLGILIEENVFDRNGHNPDYPPHDRLITPGTKNVSSWAAVTDGKFIVRTEDNTDYRISGVNFTGAQSMVEVAAMIELAINQRLGVSNGVSVSYWRDAVIVVKGNYPQFQIRSVTANTHDAGTELANEQWFAERGSAHRTTYNHNIYNTTYSLGTVARGNILSRASATGIQARNGGIVEDNLIVGGSAGINWGWYGGEAEPTPGGVTGWVRGNVILDSAAREDESGQSEGVTGIVIGNVAWGIVENNVISRFSGTLRGTAINLSGKVDSGHVNPWVGINNLNITANIVRDHGVPLNFAQSNFMALRASDNVLLATTDEFAVRVRDPLSDPREVVFNSNRYYSNLISPKPFVYEGAYYNFSEWQTHAADSSSVLENPTFLDAHRSLASYHGQLGRAASTEAFLAESRKQSRANWRDEYTATRVNSYIRQGLTILP